MRSPISVGGLVREANREDALTKRDAVDLDQARDALRDDARLSRCPRPRARECGPFMCFDRLVLGLVQLAGSGVVRSVAHAGPRHLANREIPRKSRS
jgi:hypothetical protein